MNLTIHLEESEERAPLGDIDTITVETPDGKKATFVPEPEADAGLRLIVAFARLFRRDSGAISSKIMRMAYKHGLISFEEAQSLKDHPLAIIGDSIAFHLTDAYDEEIIQLNTLEKIADAIGFADYKINSDSVENSISYVKRRECNFAQEVVEKLTETTS